MSYRFNKILSSFKSITDKSDNKYVEKIYTTINNRVKGKEKYESTVEYKNDENSNNLPSENQSLEYDEVFPHDNNITNDSGILVSKFSILTKDDTSSEDVTPVKTQEKKIHFSPEVSTVVEVEVQETESPTYCNSTPYKYLTRISETPKLQKVEYEHIVKTTVKKVEPKEVITEDVLKAANLIRETKVPQKHIDLSEIQLPADNFVRSTKTSSSRSLDERFIVNLFESRPSKRWKRQSVCVANLHSPAIKKPLDVTHDAHVEDRRPTISELRDKQAELESDAMFQKLKKLRDVECVKMNQASKILKTIREKANVSWSEELLAEKILLETDEKYKLIVNEIRDLKYSGKKTKRSTQTHPANITVSNFKYLLKDQDRKKSHKSREFFVLTLSHGTDFVMSTVTTPTNNCLVFSESFTFRNVDSNFNITAKLFTIKLKKKRRLTQMLLKRKAQNLCPMSKIYYENVHTYELEESSVLKTSFVKCGEMNITKNDIGDASLTISNIPEGSQVQNKATFSVTLDNLDIDSKISGFLTLGIPNKQNDVLFWERKWCVLDKTNFYIYNYPSDEDFGEPVTTINLEYCLVPFLTNVNSCTKKRNFLLKTGRPSLIDDNNGGVALRKKSNFVLEKFYFTADNKEDFNLWTDKIDSILTCLKDWRKLIFMDDYY